MYNLNYKEKTLSLFSLAYNISIGKSIVWYVNNLYDFIKFEIESELNGKNGLPLFYNKTKILVTSFYILENNKIKENKQSYLLGKFFEKYTSNGFFFQEKKQAMIHLVSYMKTHQKNVKVVEYVNNYPEFFI